MSSSLKSLGPGPDPPKIIDVLIEIPKNSKIKYEVDIDSGILRVDRVLSVAVSYPCNYGFIPGTLEEGSKDPIDAYVICEALLPLSIVSCSPIGVILTDDQDGKDAKIIAVPEATVSQEFGKVDDILDLDTFFRAKLEHFIKHHKDMEPGKFVRIVKWEEKNVAEQIISQAIERNQLNKTNIDVERPASSE
jgi:inorganic pyrophosphatase